MSQQGFEQLRFQACTLVRNGQHRQLRDLFCQGQITPNSQGGRNGLAPVHYTTQMFADTSPVLIEDVDRTVKVLLEFRADFSLTASIKNRQGMVKTLSAMDMVVNNVRSDGVGRLKYERGFLPNFKPYHITRALRSVPTSAPHPDLVKKPRIRRTDPKPSDFGGLPPGIVRFIRHRTASMT